MDGESALLFRVANARNPAEAEKAVNDYLQVAQMIQGWPHDIKIPASDVAEPATRDDEVGNGKGVTTDPGDKREVQ